MFDDYTRAENLPRLLGKADDICALLSKLPKGEPAPGRKHQAPYLVIIDIIRPERSLVAGHPDKAPRLTEEQWKTMMDNVEAVARLAWEKHGVRPVVHPHAGGYIEFTDEIEKLLEDLPYETVGLCLDTGHLYYSRMDPVTCLADKYDRIDFIHFKDIDQDVYENVLEKGTDFFDACAEKVMCPIGQGIVDYEAVRRLLEKLHYQGWITLEQERDPRDTGSSLKDVSESLANLRNIGF